MMRFATLILAALALLLPLGAEALTTQEQHDLELATRFRVLQKYKEALPIYQRLFALYPNELSIIDGYKEICQNLKMYTELELLLERRWAANPNNNTIGVELASTYLQENDLKKANEVFDKVIDQSPLDQSAYSLVANAQLRFGYTDEAIKTYRKAQDRLSNPLLFALELGNLYEVKGDLMAALEIYLEFVQRYPDRYRVIEDKVRQIGKAPEDLTKIELRLKRSVDLETNNFRLLQLLASVQARVGKLEDAMAGYKQVDKMTNGQGSVLYDFGKALSGQRQYGMVLRVCDYLRATYPSGDFGSRVDFLAGEALEGLGRFEDAIAKYDSISLKYKEKVNPEAGYRQAEVCFGGLKDWNRAIAMYKKVTDKYPNTDQGIQSAMRIGDAYVMLGTLDQAREQYNTVRNNPKLGKYLDKLFFSLGECDFYLKQFDRAKSSYEELLKQSVVSDYANDALARLMLIGDAGENKADLELYSEAMLESARGNDATALTKLATISDGSGENSLGPARDYESAKLMYKTHNYSGALRIVENLRKAFPKALQIPQALLLAGDITRYELNLPSSAIPFYRDILDNHPESICVQEARLRLREIEPPAGKAN